MVDFFLPYENVYIECKAIELQAYTSVNPTDELLYNSLKDSILKAYFKQLLTVSEINTPASENWGVILTYKEFFWGSFVNLFDVGKDKFNDCKNFKHLPPENVFIIDICSWDKIVQIVKDKKSTLSEILSRAKRNNSDPSTKKQLFQMHLDIYNVERLNLGYLKNEIEQVQILV